MSTAEFGDPNLGQAPAPAPAYDGLVSPQPLSVAAPVDPLTQPLAVAAPQPVAPPVDPVEASAVPVQDMRDVPLGTLIFRAGLLTEEHLEEALQDGMKRGKRLGEVLLERGLVSEVDLGRLLAGQKGLRFVELDAAAVDPAAVQLLPVEKARLHSMLPIGFQDGLPVVAVADPSNDLVLENVRRALNCEPHLVVAGREALHRQIELAYGAPASHADPVVAAPQQPLAAPVAPVAVDPQAVPPVAVDPQTVPPVTAPAPLVVQPQAPPGEGVWLGAPEPTFQPDPVAYETPQPVFVPEPVLPVVEPVQPATEPPVVEQTAPEPVPISYVPAEPVVSEPLVAAEPVVLPEPVVASEPLVAAEPVAFEQPAVAPEPVFAPEPVLEAPAPVFEQQLPDPEPAAETDATWSVVLRLADGEQLEIGAFRSGEEARDHAQGVVRQIASEHSWPFFEGRFIRPEAIISVDLVAAEGGRWLGSSLRRQWAQS